MMNFRLNDLGFLCQDFQQSLASYRDHLGNQVTARWYNRGLLDIAFLGGGCDVTVELVGPPHLDYELDHIARHGYTINHTSYLVADTDSAFEELSALGVEVAWEPMDVFTMRQCGFRDPDGLLFEVYSNLDPAMPLAGPDLSTRRSPGELRLHYISLLTLDISRSTQFYTEVLA
jgi:catechol 2,3-dioxygenase-like lactoylglutathione lyase family enzyme